VGGGKLDDASSSGVRGGDRGGTTKNHKVCVDRPRREKDAIKNPVKMRCFRNKSAQRVVRKEGMV